MPYLGSYVFDPDSDADPEPATPGTNFRECRRDALMLVPKGHGSIAPLVDRSEEIPPDEADYDPAWEQAKPCTIPRSGNESPLMSSAAS